MVTGKTHIGYGAVFMLSLPRRQKKDSKPCRLNYMAPYTYHIETTFRLCTSATVTALLILHNHRDKVNISDDIIIKYYSIVTP